ncbi:MAG: hypothetical protein ACRENI_06205 [Gemmatimonadaceae bacterium]
MMSTVRVFVNASGVDVPLEATALDAVRATDAAMAREVERGTRYIADSRGLVTPPDTPAYAGAIYRVVRTRAAGGDVASG